MNALEKLLWRIAGRTYRLWMATWKITIVLPDGSSVLPREYPFGRDLFAIRERDVLVAAAAGRFSTSIAMIAEGKDGDRAAEVAGTLGVRAIRGSTRHHPIAAALSFTRALRKSGEPALLVVDGPVGPIGIAKDGVVALAAHAGRQIIPVALDATPKITLSYLWSRMIVPLPFARVRVVFACPIEASDPRSTTREALAAEVTAAIAKCADAARGAR